jgi:hypothetical protein
MTNTLADGLRTTVDAALPRLLAIAPPRDAHHPAPGKWSPREIVGHLIDSAWNNHTRFVLAQDERAPEIHFTGDAQDDWVARQRYADRPWPQLVALWHAVNHHVAHGLAAMPPNAHDRLCRHPDRTAPLRWFVADYLAHLRHHLQQVFAIAAQP